MSNISEIALQNDNFRKHLSQGTLVLTQGIRNFKNNTWDISNRMNKLITDTEKNSIFNLRLGGNKCKISFSFWR